MTWNRQPHKLKSPGSIAGQSDGLYILWALFSYRNERIGIKNPHVFQGFCFWLNSRIWEASFSCDDTE